MSKINHVRRSAHFSQVLCAVTKKDAIEKLMPWSPDLPDYLRVKPSISFEEELLQDAKELKMLLEKSLDPVCEQLYLEKLESIRQKLSGPNVPDHWKKSMDG